MKEKEERNQAIYQEYLDDPMTSFAKLGKKHGVSRQRVYVLVERERQREQEASRYE